MKLKKREKESQETHESFVIFIHFTSQDDFFVDEVPYIHEILFFTCFSCHLSNTTKIDVFQSSLYISCLHSTSSTCYHNFLLHYVIILISHSYENNYSLFVRILNY